MDYISIDVIIKISLIIGAIIVCLGGLTVSSYGCLFIIQFVRKYYLQQQRLTESLSVQVKEQTKNLQMKLIEINRRKLQEDKNFAELSNGIQQYLIRSKAELKQIKKDANAKASGILSELAETMQKQMEERSRLTETIESLEKRLIEEQKRSIDLIASKTVDAENIATMNAQNSALQDQVADLRAFLTAAETKRPINDSLLYLGKSIDDMQRRFEGLEEINSLLVSVKSSRDKNSKDSKSS